MEKAGHFSNSEEGGGGGHIFVGEMGSLYHGRGCNKTEGGRAAGEPT
jgi:hypothetical protein